MSTPGSTPGRAPGEAALQPLYGALIALHDDALLVPNSALVEVLPGERLKPGEGQPGWLGTLDWRSQQLPVISFELLNGERAPGSGDRRVRLLVLHALDERLPARAWALRCSGYPRMIPLSPAALESIPLREHDHPDLVLARVRIGVREVAIPDLDRIEAGLLAARAATD